ncbi:glycosyltransferase family 32 protein [Endozoicomonas numazuensis]|uniref:glycosyltransferase family 32 protein n=1 Tax=Endozoicomonas numazuensis TaxID=1137799 RepID=UPI001267C77D|nr:hypothetical protein [Endozoicomonas numazuensis]
MISIKNGANPALFSVCRSLILLFALLSGCTEAAIPGKIHQIWIGDKLPEYLHIISQSFKKVKGWEYNLWRATQNNFFEQNGKIIRHTWTESGYSTKEYYIGELFDNEYSTILAILERHKTSKDNHLASLGDTLRYRIIYDFGGFYFDMKFELLKPEELSDLITQSIYNLITANEFAFSSSQKGYLSNGFFAAEPDHPALSKMLSSIHSLEAKIAYSKVDIFGPGFFLKEIESWFRSAAPDQQLGWLMLPHSKIYPYIDWAPREEDFSSDTTLAETALKLREAGYDSCVAEADPQYKFPQMYLKEMRYLTVNGTSGLFYLFPCIKYPDAIAIDHFDYGSSWNSHNRYAGKHR